MIIDINNTTLVADISKMQTPSKIKKVSGKPFSVEIFNNVSGGFIVMKYYYTQSGNSVELTIKNNGEYYRAIGKASGHGYHCKQPALADEIAALTLNITDDKGQGQGQDIVGRGDTAMRDVVFAITKTLNWDSVSMNEFFL